MSATAAIAPCWSLPLNGFGRNKAAPKLTARIA
jgi:hypothetical protein